MVIDTGDTHRTRTAIEAAVDLIVEYWPGSLTPPPQPGAKTRTPAASKPPLPLSALNAREAAWRDMHRWGQMVTVERGLHLGARSSDGPDLALFLARHADWLSRHDKADQVRRNLQWHANTLRDLATGSYTRRFPVGACPEPVIDDAGVEVGRCPGSLFALLRREDAREALLPRMVTCDADRDHVWAPSQWHALGRRLGVALSPDGMERLTRAITQPVTYRTG